MCKDAYLALKEPCNLAKIETGSLPSKNIFTNGSMVGLADTVGDQCRII